MAGVSMASRRSNGFQVVTRTALAAGFLAAVLTSAATPSRAASNPYDGRWSVEVLTQSGNCDKAYRYAVVVEGGRLRYGGSEQVAVSGSVTPAGALSGSIQLGPNVARAVGKLSGASGQGTWTISGGDKTCSGGWNAERRG